jgi:metal-responsive CopG/Arc/MetJ family transcriptional regulator
MRLPIPRLRFFAGRCIHLCMANVLSVRLPGSLLAKVDRKAASLGRRRAEHVRQVLEADVASNPVKRKRFASLSLKGRYALGHGSDNAAVRQALARRAYEKNR